MAKKTMDEKMNDLREQLNFYKIVKDTIEQLDNNNKWRINDETGEIYDWAFDDYAATYKLITILESL